jgi:hypothetical protein
MTVVLKLFTAYVSFHHGSWASTEIFWVKHKERKFLLRSRCLRKREVVMWPPSGICSLLVYRLSAMTEKTFARGVRHLVQEWITSHQHISVNYFRLLRITDMKEPELHVASDCLHADGVRALGTETVHTSLLIRMDEVPVSREPLSSQCHADHRLQTAVTNSGFLGVALRSRSMEQQPAGNSRGLPFRLSG